MKELWRFFCWSASASNFPRRRIYGLGISIPIENLRMDSILNGTLAGVQAASNSSMGFWTFQILPPGSLGQLLGLATPAGLRAASVANPSN
jgi:hypothetical protein